MRNTVQSSTRGLIFGLLTASLLSVPAFAEKPAAIDPKALEVLKQSAAAYAALDSYSCQAVTELKIDALPGSRIIKINLAFQKPDHAAVSVTKHGETERFLTDGKNLYLYAPDKNEYPQKTLPLTAPAAAPVLTQGQSFIGLILMKTDGLLTDDGNIEFLTLGSPEMLDSVLVQTVTKVMDTRSGNGVTVFYVTIGVKDHLLYRIVDTIMSSIPLPLGEAAIKAKRVSNTETYTNIQINPLLPAAAFLPPAGAKKTADTETK